MYFLWWNDMNDILDRTKELLFVDQKYKIGDVSKMWPMTNENLREMHKIFDVKDKSVLTVTSSGDHILEAMLGGAKVIDSFDINHLTRYYYHLKKAMIESFRLKLYIDVAKSFSYGFISDKHYQKIRKNLHDEYKIFWDEIIDYYSDNYDCDLSNIYNTVIRTKNINRVNYLSRHNYLLLRDKLAYYNTGFINSDIFSLDTKLDKSYDLIYLSNIYGYTDRNRYNGLKKVKEYAKKKLYPYLNDGGTIVYAYIYDFQFDQFKDAYKIKNDVEEAYVLDNYGIKKDCLLTLKR